MPVGRPDWYNAQKSSNLVTLSDMGELAVRLGSFINYYRDGKVVFYDTFTKLESSWNDAGIGVAGAAVISNSYYVTDGASVYNTINTGISNYWYLSKQVPSWNKDVVSFETALLASGLPDNIGLYITYYGTLTAYLFGIKYYPATGNLYYIDATGSTVLFTTGPSGILPDNYFLPFKLSGDNESGYYKSLRIGAYEYDMSALLGQAATPNPTGSTTLTFRIAGNASGNINVHIDRVILTEDE